MNKFFRRVGILTALGASFLAELDGFVNSEIPPDVLVGDELVLVLVGEISVTLMLEVRVSVEVIVEVTVSTTV